ncbi:HMG box [Dictyocaulus viviparus]|uniref:HMG box n=1 Tax=Dictyocaulus viviparus TaxID=29172 RepID=A0A0D8Y7W7_DICVI|nr:HMG box [Dictyocaulus viviparus]
MIVSRQLLYSVEIFEIIVLLREKQHKYPVTGMTMGPCAFFIKEQFAKNRPKNLLEGKRAMREAAVAWKSLDEAAKKKYEDLSKRYRDEKINEFEALSDEEKKELIESSLETKAERARRKIRKERREMWDKTGHPEKPLTSYNLFVQEKFSELKDRGETVTPVVKTMSHLSAEWKAMNDCAKEPYVSKAAKLLDEYKSKLDAWKVKARSQKVDK